MEPNLQDAGRGEAEIAESVEFHPSHSPLFMVMNDPVIHSLISYLAARKREQELNPGHDVRIELSRTNLALVKETFRQRILKGELNLHLVSQMLASHFLGNNVELHSNVIGILPGGESRPFLIRERITREMLFSHTDLDLGNQMVSKFRYEGADGWAPLTLAANFIEYLPRSRSDMGVNRITSRVKAEEELWNKVADELFALDDLVRRDKHLFQYSKFVKDIFGIKIVCENVASCLELDNRLRALSLRDSDPELPAHHRGNGRTLHALENGRSKLEFIETKDYLTCGASRQKKTGWKAIKSVVKWNNEILEIQIQPLDNYYLELDHMAGPSHNSFKIFRDSLRNEVAVRVPLYGFYRDLLRCIFLDGEIPYAFGNVSVVMTA